MTENTRTPTAEPRRTARSRGGQRRTRRASREIDALMAWIDEARATERTLWRNTLAFVAVGSVALLLAIRVGLLS